MKKDRGVYCERALFIAPIYYGLCVNAEQFQRELKALRVKTDHVWLEEGKNGTCHILSATPIDKTDAAAWRAPKRICIVCIDAGVERPVEETYGLLVHEAVHVWQEVLDVIGERAPSSEFMAYGIQTIAQQLMVAFRDGTHTHLSAAPQP